MTEKEIKQQERISKISVIRVVNNKCWMNILRLAWKHAPKETAEIFREIQNNDKVINDITKEMCDE